MFAVMWKDIERDTSSPQKATACVTLLIDYNFYYVLLAAGSATLKPTGRGPKVTFTFIGLYDVSTG